MKLTDDLVETFGYDILLHFAFAYMGVSFTYGFSDITTLIVAAIILVLCVLKEWFFDDYFDWFDLLAGTLGIISAIIYKIYFV